MRYGIFALILLTGLIILPVGAAEITLSSDRNEYYIPLGEVAEIPLTAISSYDRAIEGTFRFTTVEQLQNAGMVMMSTQNQAYSHPLKPGVSNLSFSAGASDVEKSMRVQVSYDYSDPSQVQVTLPEIVIHFVAQPPPSGGTQSPVTSTSSPGSGNVPATSSLQIIQQSVNVQQQPGRSGNLQQVISNNQMHQDANALKEQLQKEAARKEQDKTRFDENLDSDPLMKSINESMAADGFFRTSRVTNPESGESGSFETEYQNSAGESASVAGNMEKGVIPSLTVTSTASLNVTAPLESNTTYQSMTQKLRDQGFSRNLIHLNISAGGATINLTYQNVQGKRVFINATSEQGNLTWLTMETEPEAQADYLPVIAICILGAVIVIGVWIIIRRYRRHGKQVAGLPIHPATPLEPFDHRKAALDLLALAESAFREKRFTDAYGMAGQALRLFLSWEYGARHEMTNEEMIAFLRLRNRDFRQVESVLDRCSDIEFAKGAIDEGEFFSLLEYIRGLISEP